MEVNIQKTKQFLIPIVSLVILSVISISIINTYININMFQKHIERDIKSYKKDYLTREKQNIYNTIQLVDTTIKFQITLIENKLKLELKERIETALSIASYIYETNKDKHTKKELQQKVGNYLNSIKFNGDRGYYYTIDNDTNIIVSHGIDKFVGRNMTNFKDVKGTNLMNAQKSSIKDKKIGFAKIYFYKPGIKHKEFPKIIVTTKFEPLNLLIGTGEYLDIVEEKVKKYVLSRFSQNVDKSNYLSFLNLHNINGGNDYGTVLLSRNKPTLVGKKISDDYKDIKGNEPRKMYLKGLKDKGEVYIDYWFKKPGVVKPNHKMTYFYLQKDWNWILASGFYYDALEKQIASMEKSLKDYTSKRIFDTILWVLVFSFIVILIAVYVSIQIDKTIKKYADELVKQEKLIHQQSKMVSMGEMIGNIAHQWRQPLSVISTAATGMKMQKEFGVLEDEDFTKTCDKINQHAQYLSKTIDDFRNFIKGERVKSVFKLKDGINGFYSLIEGSIKSHNINLIIDIDDDIQIDGYQNELNQCFINIFNNAKDVLKEQNEENRLLFISGHKENDKLVIIFKDSGGGISNSIISKIFDPYFTTKHKSQGTGLGLNMTYKLITEGMNGTLNASTVSYTHNKQSYIGAEFIITLPIS